MNEDETILNRKLIYFSEDELTHIRRSIKFEMNCGLINPTAISIYEKVGGIEQ